MAALPGCFRYNVAKSHIHGLLKSLAIEWGAAIRTVGLAPGFIDSPSNQIWFDSFPDARSERQRTIDSPANMQHSPVVPSTCWMGAPVPYVNGE